MQADAQELDERFGELAAQADFVGALQQAVAAINADKTVLHRLHEAQSWRLAWWRLAREKLSYRRFFEIADLIGVRQEMRRVFRDSHRTVLRLAQRASVSTAFGSITWTDLQIPKVYLQDLRQAFQSVVRRDPLIHVEKILTGDERLRTTWKIAGTTGYEFITALCGLYVDAAQEEAMTRAYAEFLGGHEDLRAMIAEQKRFDLRS